MAYANNLGEIYVNFNAENWVKTIEYRPEKVPPKELTPTSWQYSFTKAQRVKQIPQEERQRWSQIAPLKAKLLHIEKQLTAQVRIYNENLAEFSKLAGQPMRDLSARSIISATQEALMASPLAMPSPSSIEGMTSLAMKVILPLFPVLGDAVGKLVGMIADLFSNKKKKMEHFARQLEYRANLITNYQRGYIQVAAQLRWLLQATPDYKNMMMQAVSTARNAQSVAVKARKSFESDAFKSRAREIQKIRQLNKNRVAYSQPSDRL